MAAVPTLVPSLTVGSHEDSGWNPILAFGSQSDKTTAMKASVRVWFHGNNETVLHYQGAAAVEKKEGSNNAFRLFVSGLQVHPDGSRSVDDKSIEFPTGVEWNLEEHNLMSKNASAKVLILAPANNEFRIKKMQLVLPVNDGIYTADCAEAFFNVMKDCQAKAALADEFVLRIPLGDLLQALNGGDNGGDVNPLVEQLAAMDPALFGGGGGDGDSSGDDEDGWGT